MAIHKKIKGIIKDISTPAITLFDPRNIVNLGGNAGKAILGGASSALSSGTDSFTVPSPTSIPENRNTAIPDNDLLTTLLNGGGEGGGGSGFPNAGLDVPLFSTIGESVPVSPKRTKVPLFIGLAIAAGLGLFVFRNKIGF